MKLKHCRHLVDFIAPLQTSLNPWRTWSVTQRIIVPVPASKALPYSSSVVVLYSSFSIIQHSISITCIIYLCFSSFVFSTHTIIYIHSSMSSSLSPSVLSLRRHHLPSFKNISLRNVDLKVCFLLLTKSVHIDFGSVKNQQCARPSLV